jgi:hypothetical protein
VDERHAELNEKMNLIKEVKSSMQEQKEEGAANDFGHYDKSDESQSISHYIGKLVILAAYLAVGASVMHGDDTQTFDCYDPYTVVILDKTFTQTDVPGCTRPWTWEEGIVHDVYCLGGRYRI